MDRGQLVVAVAVLAVAGLAGWWFGAEPAPPPPLRLEISNDQGSVTVHVSGAVAEPGLVEVESGGRVADAIARAGGLLAVADSARLNLAAPLVDGQQVVVPEVGEPGDPVEPGPIRLNSASAQELETITGVGPVLAARIVEYRQANGPFTTIEDLLGVPGIGESKLAALRNELTVP